MSFFKKEMEMIIKVFMFNLLGLPKRNIDECTDDDLVPLKNNKDIIFYENGFIYFHKSYDTIGYKISVSNSYDINYQLEMQVFNKLLEKTENFIKAPYFQYNERMLIYKNALEEELIAALINKDSKDIGKIVELLQKLKLWASKSYEGKKMSFAFIIDPLEAKEDSKLDYISFLDSDFSATITDGITSVITLDLNCRYMDYNSIINKGLIIFAALQSEKSIPIRFAQILCNYVHGQRLGIILLTNGDILLARNMEILYVLRNGQWINFASNRYMLMIKSIISKRKINLADDKIKEMFATILDVSFSHSGGIIAVVNRDSFLKKSIISEMDNYSSIYDGKKMTEEEYKKSLFVKFKEEYQEKYLAASNVERKLTDDQNKKIRAEFEKRFNKRIAIESLINNKNEGNIKFTSLNRKLRTELVGMDGATILDENGGIIAFGAIIENEKGSSGGGRGAAASSLSNFGGFASKISTDGYIELYVDREILYQIK